MSTIAQANTSVPARLREWFFRSQSIEHACSQQLSARQKADLKQAQQYAEVADRVLDYPQNYEAGAPLGAVLALYHDSVWWSLQVVSEGAHTGDALTSTGSPAEESALQAAAESDEELAYLRAQFLARTRVELSRLPDESQTELGAHVRGFVHALLGQAGARDTRLLQLSRQRWLRPLLAFGAVVGAVLAVVVAASPGDVAASKPWRTSSRDATFDRAGNTSTHGLDGLMFHTAQEENPWVIIDLEEAHKLRALSVSNRQSCCKERAVPLIVELSMDQKHWQEVARKQEVFDTWEADFRETTARYARLRVPRRTFLHLHSIELMGR